MKAHEQETLVNEWPRAVPYKALEHGFADARTEDAYHGLDELAASIAAKGLLQPIVVRPVGAGERFEIIAGKRRYFAICVLIEDGRWERDRPVPVTVRDDTDAEAFETSLMENVVRLPMHPVSQYEAFAALEEHGLAVAEIAARFGVGEKRVRQFLALGRLHPDIRQAWREGKHLDAEAAMAFTLTGDQKLQLKVFNQLHEARYRVYAHSVKQALRNDRPSLNDPLVKLVGLERYRKAGGEVVESLFSDEGYVADGALLKSLARDVLREKCNSLVKEGWGWAEPADDLPAEWRGWRCLHPAPKPSKADEKRLDEITTRLEELEEAEAWTPEDDEEETRLREEQDAIEERAYVRGFTKAQRKDSGCAVEIGFGGGIEIRYGLIRPGDPDTASGEAGEAEAGPGGREAADPEEDTAPGIPNALALDLYVTRTHAAAKTLAADFDLALRLAVAALTSVSAPVKLQNHGFARESRMDAFGKRIAALHNTKREGLENAFAKLVAEALDLRPLDLISSNYAGANAKEAEAVAAALDRELYERHARELFDPEDYFRRAPKAVAIAAIEEMGGPRTGMAQKKKSLVAALAADDARGSGWLPPELRHPDHS